jgi:predicted amidohydrolase
MLLEQARGADLIILPEMFTTGFSMESETLAEAENGPTSKWLKAQAAKLNAVITGSVIIQAADGSHRNRLLWARPDGEVCTTTSATCSAWRASTITTRPASARCSSNSRAGAFGR